MSAASPLAVTLESIASCFEGIVPSSICTCSPDGTPNMTYLSVVHLIDSHHVGLSYQFFNKTRENMVHNPLVQVVVISASNLRQYRLDLRYERTDTEGAVFDRIKTRLDAVASQTGMSQVFRLHGVDIFEVLDCRPMNAETGGEGLLKADYLPLIEEFTARLAACSGLESLINTSLDALSAAAGLASPESDRKCGSVKESSALRPSVAKWCGPRTSDATSCIRVPYDPRWRVMGKTACLNGRSLCRDCRRSKASW
jgi:adenylate cyclase